MKLLKPFPSILFALALTVTFTTAQAPTAANAQPFLDPDPGYQPTVFQSYDQVKQLYDQMPWSEFKPGVGTFRASQCYMRAQLWTYDFYRNHQVNAMKIFVFYTHAYKKWHREWAKKQKLRDKTFDWWYHVAPYVIQKDPVSQQLKEWVLDPTFDELDTLPLEAQAKPLHVQDWASLFVYSGRPCKENVRYQDFQCEVIGKSKECPTTRLESEHCYLVKVPATVYQPDDILAQELNPNPTYLWDEPQIEESLEKAPDGAKNEKFWRKRIGFKSKFNAL